jgi:hypothetical protein
MGMEAAIIPAIAAQIRAPLVKGLSALPLPETRIVEEIVSGKLDRALPVVMLIPSHEAVPAVHGPSLQ